MKLFFKGKDGGKDSTVTGYWLIENKKYFSICLLRFDGESRNAFHTHAFNCISVILKGGLIESMLSGKVNRYSQFKPFITKRTDFHKVDSIKGVTWLITIRGPWLNTWKEYLPTENKEIILTNGRKILKGI